MVSQIGWSDNGEFTANTEQDPLARLVVDQAQANRELLASTLEGNATLDPRAGTYTLAPFARSRFSARQLVICGLLARKAIALLTDFQERATPKDLERELGIAGGTLRPVLKRLLSEGLIVRRAGSYEIPNPILAHARIELDTKGEK